MTGKYRFQKLLLACGLFAACIPAWAATATSNFQVTATITSTCTIASAALPFGTIPSPIASNIDVNGSVTATCSNLTPYTVGLNAGIGAGATVASRKMSSGPNLINYSMFQDAGRTVNWGNTPGTDALAGIGNGAAQVIPVFGRIFTGQSPPIGSYADTITATITF